MGVPAFTNRVGVYHQHTNVKVERRIVRSNGDEVPWHTVYEDAETERFSGKSDIQKTHVVFIKGRPWRHPTVCGRDVTNIRFHNGEGSQLIDGDWYFYRGCSLDRVFEYWQPDGANPGFGSDEHNKCIVECLNKLGQNKAQYGQYLAESVKSANMLATRGTQFLEAYRSLRSGRNPFKAASIVKNIPDNYLEWQYGWKPLASDLYSMFNILQDGLKLPQFIHARRVIKSSRHGEHKPAGGAKKGTWKSNLTDICSIWASLKDDRIQAAKAIGLANPAQLGWELVPYSFVLDWFVPVGNVLQTLSDTAGLDFVSGHHSHSMEFTTSHESEVCGSADLERFAFERHPYWDFPSGIKPYANDRPFNTSRVQSMLALFTQLRR